MSETDQGSTKPDFDDPKDKLVLLVDDDESILDLLEFVVKKEGFKVERAVDGQEALRKAEALHPDAIILDFMLPGLGGFEVLKSLQMGDCRGIPVFVITGRRIDRQTIEMVRQESNVREFMEKPIKPAVLSAMLHRLLHTRPPELRPGSDLGPISRNY